MKLGTVGRNPILPVQPLSTVQTNANPPHIKVIKNQCPNATEWALTPMNESIATDIRQNLTLLHKDLLDEGKKGRQSRPRSPFGNDTARNRNLKIPKNSRLYPRTKCPSQIELL